jgi:hypothetical protein
VFTGLWLSAKSSGDAACIQATCDQGTANHWQGLQTTDTVALVIGFGVAAAGAIVGTVLLLNSAPTTAPAAPSIGFGPSGIEGRFW